MRLIKQSYEILTPIDADNIMSRIEASARLCYKSEDKIGPGSADAIVKSLIKNGHGAMIEHAHMTVRFVTDRGVTHELVRHRLCSFAQESTRYCNYSKGKFEGHCTFIIPSWWENDDSVGDPAYESWEEAMIAAEFHYFVMLTYGWQPQHARSVLPNSLAATIDVTANMREWRHILQLRTEKAAHPQMRALMIPLLRELREALPVLFGDVGEDGGVRGMTKDNKRGAECDWQEAYLRVLLSDERTREDET